MLDIVFDGGAYATMSPVVLSRGAIHAGGAYRWPAIQIDSVAYRSHTPPNGAFRGFGVPQTAFAIESHIDAMAKACNIEPLQFRLQNCFRTGDTTATSQRLEDEVGARQVLELAVREAAYEDKRARAVGNGNTNGDDRDVVRGAGLSLFWHGAGFTGAGEARIAAKVALDLCADGRAHIRVSSTEMGQGSHTVLPQIVAEQLGGMMQDVVVDPVDTAKVPNSGPTVASRTTMIVGGELATCARRARVWLLENVAKLDGGDDEAVVIAPEALSAQITRVLHALGKEREVFESQHQLAPKLRWNEEKHQGDAYATYGWGAAVAEVEIDRLSLEVRVPRITVVVDVGRAVNPQMARGQVEGGILQSLGYALCEEVGVKPDGALLRDRFQTYILPTTLDAPTIDVHLLELPYERGPGGAKGLGEMPMNGGAPAVANAIEDALGVRIRDLPLTPERLFAAREEKKEAR
jgi:CO/xanthine dehydrogenase Mo-binding subunit